MLGLYIFLGVVLWFYAVDSTWDFIYESMTSIPPGERKLTSHKWVRTLMLMGCFITVIVYLTVVTLKGLLKLGTKVKAKARDVLVSDLY